MVKGAERTSGSPLHSLTGRIAFGYTYPNYDVASLARSDPVYGRMFWFIRKKFVGSYVRLSAWSRAYFASP